jgi:SAM-dependent methyltransferase
MERVIYERMAATQQEHWWFAARRRILERVLQTLRLAPNSAILEVGCGTGANIPMLRRFGSVAAVELDPFARQHVRSTMNVEVVSGSLPDDLPYAERKFDVICLFDVLEHVERHQEALEALRQRLAPNGILMITVPAYQWLYSSHDARHHHFRRYTALQLRSVAKAAGLLPIRLGYFNTLLFPLALLRRLAAKLLGEPASDDSALPSSWINHLLYRAFSIEGALVARCFFPFGLSAIGLFRGGARS